MQYPPELLQALASAGHDPQEFLVSKTSNLSEHVETKILDPIEARLMALEEENLIAFRISKEGFDTVYNIAEHWTYSMVLECQEYLDSIQEYRDREIKKAERNNR